MSSTESFARCSLDYSEQRVLESHITLSPDGYCATRTQGCRQSVAIGSNPLVPQSGGLYFEVTVDDMVDEWVGGLGIGVTRSVSTWRGGPTMRG